MKNDDRGIKEKIEEFKAREGAGRMDKSGFTMVKEMVKVKPEFDLPSPMKKKERAY